ncbi:uncharacterized protein LOC107047545 isoform X1 [Diachasma alloeum]|uniref:uncharacterized protein LOC107047545 isoform X1 n=2 Tax=Diachasma alloeum TaxID=454923 RepID=UPI0007381C7A|nr:uncharacterized protein LOC107047545 isoform X1 [Diachasma alloeum]
MIVSDFYIPGSVRGTMAERENVEALWARIIATRQPMHGPTDCIMCRRKMKVKRSKSLSPEPSSSRDAKIPKLSDPSEANGEPEVEPISIMEFSDDVLLNIMKYLTPQDLMSLSLCCKRLHSVCRDRTLWRTVDFRSTPMQIKDLKTYVKFLQPLTTSIAINGRTREWDEGSLEELKNDFISSICETCTGLKEFIIEEYSIISTEIRVVDFPSTLEKLSLKSSKVCNLMTNKSYFFRIDTHMPNLTSLILTDCQWVTGHSLLVISKIPKLKELRLNSCKRLGECVAYASLATRFGFKALEILDLRCTAFGDSEIRCFSSTKTLTHIYLEYSPEFAETNEVREQRPRPLPRRHYEDNHVVQYIAAPEDDFYTWNDPSRCRISDGSICALGSYICDRGVLDNSIRDVILVEPDIRVLNNPDLKTLVVRNYPLVTNQSLVHLAANAMSLQYLDVTGTGVTADAVATFKTQKPDVTIISSFG